MPYSHVMDPTDTKYIFYEFSRMVFKSGEAKIDSKVSQMYRIVFGIFYAIVKHYISNK